jgi:hypothetical protein
MQIDVITIMRFFGSGMKRGNWEEVGRSVFIKSVIRKVIRRMLERAVMVKIVWFRYLSRIITFFSGVDVVIGSGLEKMVRKRGVTFKRVNEKVGMSSNEERYRVYHPPFDVTTIYCLDVRNIFKMITGRKKWLEVSMLIFFLVKPVCVVDKNGGDGMFFIDEKSVLHKFLRWKEGVRSFIGKQWRRGHVAGKKSDIDSQTHDDTIKIHVIKVDTKGLRRYGSRGQRRTGNGRSRGRRSGRESGR